MAKITIIGCGKVGSTAAYAISLQGLASELILFGRCADRVEGEELDIEHGSLFTRHAHVKATADYKDIKDSDIVIITSGAAQEPGETRLDLAAKNIKILENIIPEVIRYSPQAIIMIVSNPVDVLTYKAYHWAGLPKGRIFGTGTALDTARYRFHLSEFLKVNPRSIHAYVLGEHGDSSFAALSSASIGGQPLVSFPGFSEEKAKKAYEQTKEAAYKIIAAKGATYYAIATVIAHLVKSILNDTRTVIPVSIPLHSYHGHSGVALSVPCVIGRDGVEDSLEIKLAWEERKALEKSVQVIKSYL